MSATALWLTIGAAAIVFLVTIGKDSGAVIQHGEIISAVLAEEVGAGGPLLAAELVSAPGVSTDVGAKEEVDPAPIAPADAPGIKAEETTGHGVHVKEDVFVPPLVKVVPPKKPEDGSIFPLQDEGSGALSSEMLRIIAKMSPEQIDALTLLLLSEGQTSPSAMMPNETAEDVDAPWIGNWNEADVAGTETPEVATDAGNALGESWRVIEETDGSLFVQIPDDTFSRIQIEPGLVLGSVGVVLEVRKTPNVVLVRMSDDQFMSAPRNPSAAASDLAEQKRAAERSKGDSRMEAAAPVVLTEDPSAETVGDDRSATAGVAQTTSASTPANATTGPGWIQIGSFRDSSNAAKAEALMRAKGFETEILTASPANGSWHVVRARSQDPNRKNSLEELRAMGFPDAYLIGKTKGTAE